MIVSSLITPFRIYDTFSDLIKFNLDCNKYCEYELITDKTRLLPLQFQRNTSVMPITRAWIRPACTDFYDKIVTEGQSKFIESPAGFFTDGSATIAGEGKFTNPSGNINLSQNLVLGKKYTVKVVVIDKKKTTGATCNLILKHTVTTLANFSAIGTHIFTFIATDYLLRLEGTISNATDFITISEFNILSVNDFSELDNNDYEIPTNVFQIVKIGTKDIVSYCGSAFESTLSCGKYYLIIKSAEYIGEVLTDAYFFSEVFVIKDFVPSQSPYVLLEWYNPCDLQNVKYTGLTCQYKNRLYIDGPISKPEYPYEEEGQTDGEQRFNATFQKLEKKQTINIPMAPEYIIDACNAIKLHENISYYEKLHDEQLTIGSAQNVYSLEVETDFVADDCYGSVKLIVLLLENFIDSACCKEIPIVEEVCKTCAHTVVIGEYDEEIGYALDYDGEGNLKGYQFFDPDWLVLDLLPDEYPIFCVGGRLYATYDGNYHAVPTITDLVNIGTGFTIEGFTFAGTVVEIEITYNGNTYVWPILYDNIQFGSPITINYADIPIELILCEVLSVRVRAFNAFCPYGWSDAVTIVPKPGPEC